jgi:phosphosulfolactate phosphohydrolase-like enzyme
MKQTSIEWLIEKLNNVRPTQICSIETIKEWCNQAKEMEKEQILSAHNQGYADGYRDNGNSPIDYYNEKYEN